MKRFFALGLVLVVLSAALPALAAGKLTSTQENLYIIPYYGTSVYCDFYATLTNDGDKPVEFSTGLLELYDADGNTVTSTDVYYCYPMVLAPGENGYLVSVQYTDIPGNVTVSDHMLSVTGKGKVSQTIDRLEASAIEETQSDGYYTYNYLTATITNTTDADINSLEVVCALKDGEGNLLYVINSYWNGYNVYLVPGSSIRLQMQMDSSVRDYLTNANLVPATVDCIAYHSAPAE